MANSFKMSDNMSKILKTSNDKGINVQFTSSSGNHTLGAQVTQG